MPHQFRASLGHFIFELVPSFEFYGYFLKKIKMINIEQRFKILTQPFRRGFNSHISMFYALLLGVLGLSEYMQSSDTA